MLRRWLDASRAESHSAATRFRTGEALGVEEAYWLGVHSTRTALAAALAEMVAARGNRRDALALAFARA